MCCCAVISDVEDGEEEAAAKPKKGRRRNVEVDPKKLFAGKRLVLWGRPSGIITLLLATASARCPNLQEYI